MSVSLAHTDTTDYSASALMATFEIHDEDLVRLKDQVVLVTGRRYMIISVSMNTSETIQELPRVLVLEQSSCCSKRMLT